MEIPRNRVSMPPFQVSSHGTNDSPSLRITTHKLSGLNFLRWSQSVKLFIRGKGKLGYLTGATNMGLRKLQDHGLVSEFYAAGDRSNLHVFTHSKRALGSGYRNLI